LESLESIEDYDLYFVAPLVSDNKIVQRDITSLIKNATKKNTFFFSEYNDKLDKGFDFNTGVGAGRDGIFITDTPSTTNTFKSLGKYAVAYFAKDMDNSDSCFLKFMKMVTTKYKLKKFNIVCPDHIDHITNAKFKKYLDLYYGVIQLHKPDGDIIQLDIGDGEGVLHIRCDIFPIKNKKMLTLMKYSVNDILLTGDQSITDALSCCPDKNIFYQIVPWKTDFAKQLSKYLPNPFIGKESTSCGTVKAVDYKSDHKKFLQDWDFRTKGKPKLDAIIANCVEML
jgi:hypothetical protein